MGGEDPMASGAGGGGMGDAPDGDWELVEKATSGADGEIAIGISGCRALQARPTDGLSGDALGARSWFAKES